MRKRIVELRDTHLPAESDAGWLNLSEIATVEATSEDERFPIETVFAGNGIPGWRAGRPGKQIIRLIFDEPESQRTQEFTLSWSSAAGQLRNGAMEGSMRKRRDFRPKTAYALCRYSAMPSFSGAWNGLQKANGVKGFGIKPGGRS